MYCRGVRGATIVASNSEDDIVQATRELLFEMMYHNEICRDDIASVTFTVTKDLDRQFPAYATREFG